MSSFDENHKKILSAFITLKNKCSFLEKNTLGGLYTLNKNQFTFVYADTFYSNMRDICDLSIVFMINEEVSNATDRSLCADLLAELLTEKHLTREIGFNCTTITMDHEDFKASLSDIEKLMSLRMNQVVGSHMQDFSISAFSAFEKWISMLYSSFSSEFDKYYYESRLAKANKILESYSSATDQESKNKIAERAMKLQGIYISFPDKINAVLKKLTPNTYPRDLTADRRIIEFLRIHRNTVHNGGVHQGEPVSVEYNGTKFSMNYGAPLHSHSWAQSIELVGELLDIYTNIINSIKELTPVSLCYFQEDSLQLLVLDRVVQDFRHSDRKNTQETLALIDFLKRKINFTDELAHQFMARLTEIIDKLPPEQGVDLIELLTSDMSLQDKAGL